MRMPPRISFYGLALLFLGVFAPSFTVVQADTTPAPTGPVKYCEFSYSERVELWRGVSNVSLPSASQPLCSCVIDRFHAILVGQPDSRAAGVCTTNNDCFTKCQQARGANCFTGSGANQPACAGTQPPTGCELTDEGRQSLSAAYLASFREHMNPPRCLANPVEPAATTPGAGGSSAVLYNPLGTNLIEQLIGRVIRALTGIVGALALLMFIVGGIMYITAGDSDRVKTAKDLIVNSLFGIVIILFAYTLVSVFLSIFGLIDPPTPTPRTQTTTSAPLPRP